MFEFENGWKPLERSLRPTRCQTSKLPISKLDPYHHFFIKLFWRRFSWSYFFGYLYLGIFCGSHFFGYLYLGIFVGHISLDICIWAFFWVIFLWIVVFGYFCGSYLLKQFGGHQVLLGATSNKLASTCKLWNFKLAKQELLAFAGINFFCSKFSTFFLWSKTILVAG